MNEFNIYCAKIVAREIQKKYNISIEPDFRGKRGLRPYDSISFFFNKSGNYIYANAKDFSKKILPNLVSAKIHVSLLEKTPPVVSEEKNICFFLKKYEEALPCKEHGYLSLKKIEADPRLKVNGGTLLIPFFDLATDEFRGMQYIYWDKKWMKKYATGSSVTGNVFCFNKISSGKVYLAEGYATASTVYKSSKVTTFCCFDVFNLTRIAEEIKQNFKCYQPIIVADNDVRDGSPNVGVEAAKKTGLPYIVPCNKEGTKCDFNDIYVLYGAEEVRKQLANVVSDLEPPPPVAVNNNKINNKIDISMFDDYLQNDAKRFKKMIIRTLNHNFFVLFEGKLHPISRPDAQQKKDVVVEVDYIGYFPGKPKVFSKSDVVIFFNKYSAPRYIKPAEPIENCFLDVVYNMMTKAQADFLIQWMAFIIQNPSKPHFIIPIIIGKSGIGKGLTVKIFRKILGQNNGAALNCKKIFKKMEHFNELMGTRLLITCGELKMNDDEYNSLKDATGDDDLISEAKYEKDVDRKMTANFLFCGNNIENFTYDKGDRRIFLVNCNIKDKGSHPYLLKKLFSTYRKFEDTIEEKNELYASLYQYLNTLEIKHDFSEIPQELAMERDNSLMDTRLSGKMLNAIACLKYDYRVGDTMSYVKIVNILREKNIFLNSAQLSKILTYMGYSKTRKEKNTPSLWIKQNEQDIDDIDNL